MQSAMQIALYAKNCFYKFKLVKTFSGEGDVVLRGWGWEGRKPAGMGPG